MLSLLKWAQWRAVHSLLGPRHSLPSVGNLRVADDSQLSGSLEFSTDDDSHLTKVTPLPEGQPSSYGRPMWRYEGPTPWHKTGCV